jgi:hypothetical protein
VDSSFPIGHDGRDRAPWYGHALICDKFAYSLVQQASADPDLTPTQELDPILEPIWAQGSLADTDSLDLVLPSEKAIIEAMTILETPWDDLHHRSYFLPELSRIEAGEFTLTMIGDRSCPINPLATHVVYVEGNMETIVETIPINISRILGVMDNVLVGADCSSEETSGIDPQSVDHEKTLLFFKLAFRFESNIR